LFSVSQLCSRIAVGRVSSKLLMCVGTTISAVGILMFARLSLHAGYVEVVLSLVLVGVGNGVVVVPLTSAALAGVGPSEAGAASGVLNAMQQVGGLLGVAVLVSVFGVSGEHLARTAFVDHVDRAFFGGAMFLVAALAVLVVVVRRDRPAARLKPVSDVVATT
jgi:MFS family permease